MVRKPKKYQLIMPVEFSKLLLTTEQKMRTIRRMRNILNEILVNTGYHSKNMQRQVNQLELAGAPRNEIKMVKKAYDTFEQYAVYELMDDFKELCKQMEALRNGETGKQESK